MSFIALWLACSSQQPIPAPAEAPEPAPAVPAPTYESPPETTTTLPSEGPMVEAGQPTSLGTTAFGANGRIQPRGAPTDYYFEYGATTSYGSVTPTRSIGPQRVAYYTESWDDGLGGWRGGAGDALAYRTGDGYAGGYVRYREPTGTDYNHTDGVGLLHLVQYFYPGEFSLDHPTASLGGGEPDFRDASVRVWVRGTDWEDYIWWLDPSQTPFDRGDELAFWAQVDASAAEDMTTFSNWAHTGTFLTGALYSGAWTELAYTLPLDTNAWSYSGQSRVQNRDVYVYLPLYEVLRYLDVDFFHLLMFIDDYIELAGMIDFDELSIAYRNHSVLIPSNGGALVASPSGSVDDPGALTDGYRFGEGLSWESGPSPQAPLEFAWELADPVVVQRVMVHNHAEWPSRAVEVEVSADGVSWTSVLSGEVPTASEHGPNFDHLLATGLDVEARHVRVRVTSGYRAEAWGLGEVEVFGEGALMQTDDDWATVAEDVTGLEPGETVHYRLVAVSSEDTVYGPDQVYTVPTGEVPEVTTGVATILDDTRVRVTGVVNTLGGEGFYAFDLGHDTSYGLRTVPMWTGAEVTPRTFSRILDLAHPDLVGLTPGTTAHYRISFCAGCTYPTDEAWVPGADATFVVP